VAKEFSVTWDKPLNEKEEFLEYSKYFRKSLISIAKEEFNIATKEGFDKRAKIRTDNHWNKPLANILPFGKVEWHARVAPKEALLKVYSQLVALSPVRTGRYVSSHFVYVGTKLVASSYTELNSYLTNNDVEMKETITFVSGTPYSRKLERFAITSKGAGKIRVSKEKKVITGKAPNGVYYRVGRAVRKLLGAIGFVEFKLRPNGYKGITLPANSTGTYRSTKGKNKRSFGRPYLHPQIAIYPFKEGVLPQ